MDSSASTVAAGDRANAMYWGSDQSVNQIAEALDLSKGALYEMIRPLPAALACPRCGEETVYPNRTAKERSLVACPACGWDGAEDEAPALEMSGAVAVNKVPPSQPRARPAPERRKLPTAVPIVLGAAALGLALYLWTRRRK